MLAVASAAYLAAVFLCADATKLNDQDLEDRFRRRALAAGVVAGAIAFAGLGVIAGDADRIFHRLTTGAGLPALVVSLGAGVATLALVGRRRYEPARYSAGVAVAAVIAGWAADLDSADGTGVQMIHVWAYPVGGGAPRFVADAAYGGSRPDVAAVFGDRFRDSGFGLRVEGLPPGAYDIAIFAWSTARQAWLPAKVVSVVVR